MHKVNSLDLKKKRNNFTDNYLFDQKSPLNIPIWDSFQYFVGIEIMNRKKKIGSLQSKKI